MILAACEHGDLEAVKQLICKEDLELKNIQGYTGLLIASRLGHTHIVEELVHSGANVNATNNVSLTQ